MTVNGALDHKNTCTASYKRETHARKEQEGKGGGVGTEGKKFRIQSFSRVFFLPIGLGARIFLETRDEWDESGSGGRRIGRKFRRKREREPFVGI